MQYTNDENADLIMSMPTNTVQASYDELKVIDTLFKNHKADLTKIANEIKDLITIGTLFIIVSLQWTDTTIQKFLPITSTSPYILLLVKSIILVSCFWIIKNFWLARK